jgi:pyrimidine operon attenuation protein/uracil phosphoribosyltransferase
MKLALSNVPATLQTRLGVSADAVVTFSRLDAGLYRDGVRFENDKQVSLQDLGPGVTAIVVDDLQGGKTAKAALVAAE